MISPGATFGRYVIVRRVGAGGMGVVYEADDPELGRRVALKLVRFDRPRRGDPRDSVTVADDSRDRLLREAQAMAKLSHPNVIAIRERTLGGEHPRVADVLVSSASNLDSAGRGEEALPLLRRAVAIYEKTVDADDPDLGRASGVLGDVLRGLGRFAEALPAYEQGLAIRERGLGPMHPQVAAALSSVGEALISLDRPAEALPRFVRALEIDIAAHGPDDSELAYDLTGIGKAHLAAGAAAAAAAPLERALALRTATPGDPKELAETQFFLAKALWESGKRARAVGLARSARSTLAAAGDGAKDDVATVDGWLAGK